MNTRIAAGLSVLLTAVILGGCEKTEIVIEERDSLGIPWVRSAAEYDALTMQAYQVAARNLDALLADKSWSALPGSPSAVAVMSSRAPWKLPMGVRAPSTMTMGS